MGKKSKFLWGYSVVLFTVAFVLILMSAVSQLRLSKDVKTYKDQLNKQEWVFQGVQESVSNLTEENRMLKDKTKEQEKQLIEYEEKLNKLLTQSNEISTQNDQLIKGIDNLLDAEKNFLAKKYKESAENLEQINYDILTMESKNLYDRFANTVFDKAANIYYNSGYRSYKTNNFEEAVENLTKSLKNKQDLFFSDDAMYFLSISMIKLGDNEGATSELLRFKELYPSSPYFKEVNRLLKTLVKDESDI